MIGSSQAVAAAQTSTFDMEPYSSENGGVDTKAAGIGMVIGLQFCNAFSGCGLFCWGSLLKLPKGGPDTSILEGVPYSCSCHISSSVHVFRLS